jgi:4-hydroxythreonine-4-phosphate dehydrogenase
MSKRRTRIGITLGDINGIGPEIAVAAAYAQWPAFLQRILIGDPQIITDQCHRQGVPAPVAWTPADAARNKEPVVWWNPSPAARPLRRTPGHLSTAAARAAYDWIVAATNAVCEGSLQALVTAPIQKEGFMRAGIDVPGHTELLARLAGVRRVEMMLLADSFRVVLATRHVPIAQVSAHLSRRGIRETIAFTADALRWLGTRRKRIAVCGLNPHAGDGGAIGREEIELIRPAIRQSQRDALNVSGPVPADTVFYQVGQGAYDAVVAMYHDQGLAPFKMVAFEQGVNLTLGLPFVRTSPDHGTAYDIAGRDRANASSMIAAIRLAALLAHRPNPWFPR